ncbi:hypothetical protein P9112_004461 [Eukaryota sp. TZLM1-RC]
MNKLDESFSIKLREALANMRTSARDSNVADQQDALNSYSKTPKPVASVASTSQNHSSRPFTHNTPPLSRSSNAHIHPQETEQTPVAQVINTKPPPEHNPSSALSFYVQSLVARLDSLERLVRRSTRLRPSHGSVLDSIDESISNLTSTVSLLGQCELIDKEKLKLYFDQELDHLINLSYVKNKAVLESLENSLPRIPEKEFVLVYFDSINPPISNTRIAFSFLNKEYKPLFPPKLISFPCVRFFDFPLEPVLFMIEVQLPGNPPVCVGWAWFWLFQQELNRGALSLPLLSPPFPREFSDLEQQERTFSGKNLYLRVETGTKEVAYKVPKKNLYYKPLF